MTDKTQFDYLLNAFERASQSEKPADLDYAGKRKSLYAYVRGLEGKAQKAVGSEHDKTLEEAAAHFESSHRELWTPAIAEEIRSLKGQQPAQADKPSDCSNDPSSCPDNEGRGCYCTDNKLLPCPSAQADKDKP